MIKDIPANEYHNSPGLSCSLAKILLGKSPMHAWLESPMNPYRIQNESSRLDIGTIAHGLVLEGFHNVVVCDYDDWRKNAAKEERDKARAEGKTPILKHQFLEIKQMVDVARAALSDNPNIGISWEDSRPEQSLFWTQDGVECRARLDLLKNNKTIILDYKTTDLSSPAAWMRAIGSNGYDMQAAHYSDGILHETGEMPEFIFMVQETSVPYPCYFVGLPPAYLEIGRQKMKIARERWKACMDNNHWPAYSNQIMYAEPPAWEFAAMEEKMIEQQTWTKETFLFGRVKC